MNYGLRILGRTRHRSNIYAHYNTVTVNSGQVTGTLTNFPMLFTGTFSQLKTVANGGDVTNVNGYDIIFSSTNNLGGSGLIPFELVSYNASTGAVVFWVNVASMATGSVIYLLYGNSTITTSQQNKSGTWDTNFKQVSHLVESSGATLNDSTSNGNNSSTNTGTQTTGKWGNAVTFANGSSQYAAFPNGTIPSGHGSVTISAWVKFPNATNYGMVFDPRSSTAQGILSYAIITSGYATGNVTNGNGATATETVNIADGNWHYVSLTYGGGTGGASSTISLVVDNNGATTTTFAGGLPTLGATFNIGTKTVGGGATTYGTSTEQELRISNTVRSAAWIAADYNNQSAPASFYTVT